MLSYKTHSGNSKRDVIAIAEYPDELLSDEQGHVIKVEDYYSQGAAPSFWHGQGAITLGLAGRVERDQHIATLQGFDPRTGKALVAHAGPDRRYAVDATFSAPKSVSIVWGLTDDLKLRTAIEAAHDRAVERALDAMERHAVFGRQGRGGEFHASMIAAVFRHGSSRELDMLLHSHAMIQNLAQRPDGTWGAIQPQRLYQWKMALGAIYRADLATTLREMGFQIEADRDSFKIAGINPDLEKQFSKRSVNIRKRMAELGFSSSKAAEKVALGSRRPKEILDVETLRAGWRAEAAGLGFTPDQIAALRAHQQERQVIDDASILADLTQHASTFKEQDLYRAVAVRAQVAGLNAEQIEQAAQDLLASDQVIHLRAADGTVRFSTKEMVALEASLAATALALSKSNTHAVNQEHLLAAIAARPTLSDEQRRMVEHITSALGLAAVQGMPGSGKSFAIDAAREVWRASGYTVHGAAVSGIAGDELADKAHINTQTIYSLLNDLDERRTQLTKRDILVIDESGMVGSRQMRRLIDHVKAAGSKLILVGDTRQLQPIDAGGSFRAILNRVDYVELTDIRRQHEEWARQAVQSLAAGEAGKVLAEYDTRGLLRAQKNQDAAMHRLLADWFIERDPLHPGESIMLTGDRAAARALNDKAREMFRAQGSLGQAATIETTSGPREFAVNDRVLFTRNNLALQVKNGTRGTITDLRFDPAGHVLLTVQTDRAKRVAFDTTDYAHIDHGYAITVHKSQAATVDNTYVLAHESMSDREWSLVALSRHRDSAKLYCTDAMKDDLAHVMSQSHQAETTLDYEQVQKQTETEKQHEQQIQHNQLGPVLSL